MAQGHPRPRRLLYGRDKVEYRIDPEGCVRLVGIYELIRWGWSHDLDDIPERLAPYQGKIALLRRISAVIAAGQSAPFPTFLVWPRPGLSGLMVFVAQLRGGTTPGWSHRVLMPRGPLSPGRRDYAAGRKERYR